MNADVKAANHFVESNKMIEIGKGGQREVDEISFSQTYFAVQTRKQVIIEQRLLDVHCAIARDKLIKSEKKLPGIIYEWGVEDKGVALIRSKGVQALFGGNSTNNKKRKLMIFDGRPLADFLPTLTIKTNFQIMKR